MAAKLQSMQTAQDTYRSTIEGFDKPFDNLPVDSQEAQRAKEWVQGQLGDLRNMDYNDAANRNTIYNTIKNVRDFYGPQGQAGLLQSRVDQYNTLRKNIEDTYKDNPTQKGYLMNELNNQFYVDPTQGSGVTTDASAIPSTGMLDPSTGRVLDYGNKALRQNPSTGQWENTGVVSPVEWTWKDPNTEWGSAIKDVAYDAFKSTNPSWQGTPADAQYMYFLPGGDQLTKNKIDAAMYSRFMSDPDLIKSAQAQADYYGMSTNEAQFATQNADGSITWNENTLLGQMMTGRNKGSAYYRDQTEHGLMTDQNALDQLKYNREHPATTLFNESTLAGSTTMDYNTAATNVDNIQSQLAALPAEGSAQDNYTTRAQRESLQKQLTIAQNYKTALSSNYFNTTEGQTALSDMFKTGIGGTTPLSLNIEIDSNGDGTIDYRAPLSDYFKTEQDIKDYMKGDLKLPADVEGGMVAGLHSVKDWFTNQFGDQITDSGNSIPISYSANVLTGSKGSTVDNLNTQLTTRVNDNRTNYWVEGGQDLDSYLAANMEEGDKISVAMMDDDINGQYAHYMTIVDKSGATKIQVPIYPKAGAGEEQGMLGQALMTENQGKTDPLSTTNYQRGKRMISNYRYGTALDDQSANAMLAAAQQTQSQNNQPNTSSSKTSDQVTFPTQNGNSFAGYYQVIVGYDGVPQYQLMDVNKNPLGPRQKSMDDLRTWIYDLETPTTSTTTTQ